MAVKMEDKVFLKKLGETIVELRKEKNITQIDLADKCNFEKSNMRRIEAGNTNPTALTLLKISRALAILPRQLLDFEVPEE